MISDVANYDAANQRTYCPRCHHPTGNCICACSRPIANCCEVLILQHPLEVKQAKGSAGLLDLCLQRSQIWVGEQFDEASLQRALYGPSAEYLGQPQPVLLYPDTADNQAPALRGTAAPVVVPSSLPDQPQQLRLVLLDATWRKSRKMLYLNPLLQALPRVSLAAMPPSHYRIRKAHKPDQLASLEACAYALMQLEQNEARYLPLLAAFDAFVEQHSARTAAYRQQ